MILTLTSDMCSESDKNFEREVEIYDWKINPAETASRDYPGHPAELCSCEVRWADTKQELTEQEWELYIEKNWDTVFEKISDYLSEEN